MAAEEGEIIELRQTGIMRSDPGVRAEVDLQVSTAKQFPRSIKRAMDQAKSMATVSQEMAEDCLYSVPRAGKEIRGPSIRLAEIMVYTFGNMRCQATVLDVDDEFLTARGTVWDLERNNVVQRDARRRILDRHGRRYDSDMIVTTANAAMSIALRNAVFEVIPRTYVDEVYKFARAAALGKFTSVEERRTVMFRKFAAMGVQAPQVLAKLGITDEREMTLDHVETLIGVHNRLKEGDVTVEDEFPPEKPEGAPAGQPAPAAAPASKLDAAAAKLKGRKAVQTEIKKPGPGDKAGPVTPRDDGPPPESAPPPGNADGEVEGV